MTPMDRTWLGLVSVLGLVLSQCGYDVVFSRTHSAGSAGASAAGASGSSAVTCGQTSLPTGDSDGTVDVGGIKRGYIVHVPVNYVGTAPVPLVLDFHGLQDTPSIESTHSGFRELSDTEGFVVAWPEGIELSWNVGPCCTTLRTVDDIGFARALVKQLQQQACIDPQRVYATGYVMGGGMALYLGCNAADVFAGVMSSGFDLLAESEAPCKPARPITEISFRGTADDVIPYDGCACTPPIGANITVNVIGAIASFRKWASLDQCAGTPSAPDSDGCTSYSQCQGATEVTLCTTQGGGEDWGRASLGWGRLKTHVLP